MRARRALLYVPGNEQKKIEKAKTLDVDCVCLDLEDGVAANRKTEARNAVARALRELDFGRSERLARINAIGSGLEEEDLGAILPTRPDGIVVPKLSSADQMRWVSRRIAAFEGSEGWSGGSVRLLGMIETARGIIELSHISSADDRLEALIFGAEDYAADIGAIRTREGLEVLYARSAVVKCAAAFGLQAIDLLDVDFRDLERLEDEARQGARLGFAGKQVIHPNQIAPVQEAFTPDDEAIGQALRILQAAAEHQAAGSGAFAMDGKMVDMPIVRAAERVLARARAGGKIP